MKLLRRSLPLFGLACAAGLSAGTCFGQNFTSNASVTKVNPVLTLDDTTVNSLNQNFDIGVDTFDGFYIRNQNTDNRPFIIAPSAPHALVTLGVAGIGIREDNPFYDIHLNKETRPEFYMEQFDGENFYGHFLRFGIGGFEVASSGGHIPFKLLENTPSDTLVGTSDGFVGVRTATPGKHLTVYASDDTTLRLHNDTTGPDAFWDLVGGNNEFKLHYNGSFGDRIPFRADWNTPENTLCLDGTGGVGIGTNVPNNAAGAVGLPGKILNLKATAAGTAGIARLVVDGVASAHLNLIQSGAPANQKVFRIQTQDGTTYFSSVNDNMTTNLKTGLITIKHVTGRIGFGVVNPTQPLHLAGGATCVNGTTWTNASSRELKQDIEPISSQQALDAVRTLEPVTYRYKSDTTEEFAGFIAEDVPELVATGDRKGLASMDITAVLTRVVKDQQSQIEKQDATISKLMQRLEALEQANASSAKTE